MDTAVRRHRGVACFYGLLDVLRAPLARFVAEAAPQATTRGGSGVHAQLRALLDHLAGQFPDDVRRDMELLARVETQLFHEGDAGDVESAIAAATRLLEVFAWDGDEEAKKAAQGLCEWLCVGVDDTEEDDTSDAKSDVDCGWEVDVSQAIPVGDDRGGEDAKVGEGSAKQALTFSTQVPSTSSRKPDEIVEHSRGFGDEAVEICGDEMDNSDDGASSTCEPDDEPACVSALRRPSEFALDAHDDNESQLKVTPLEDKKASRLDGTMPMENEDEEDTEREELDDEEVPVVPQIHDRVSLISDPSLSHNDDDEEDEDEEREGSDEGEENEDDEAVMNLPEVNVPASPRSGRLLSLIDHETNGTLPQEASDLSDDVSSVGGDEAAELSADGGEPSDAGVPVPSDFSVDHEGTTYPQPTSTTSVNQRSQASTTVTTCSTDSSSPPKLDPLENDLETLQSDLEARSNALIARVTRSGKPSTELQAAIQQIISGRDFGTAIFSINQELKRTKTIPADHATLYGLLARCRYGLKQYPSMLKDAESGVALDPSNSDGYYWVILALDLLGRQLDAVQACVIGLAASPEQHDLVRFRQILLNKVIRTDTSAGVSAKRKDLLKQGLTQSVSGNHSDAVGTFTRLLLVAGSHKQAAPVYMHRARCYMELKQYGLAAQDASVALAVMEINVMASKTLCDALLASGKIDAASVICSRALVEYPTHALLVPIQKSIKQRVDKTQAQVTPTAVPAEATDWEQELKQLVSEGLRSNHKAADKLFDKALLLLERVAVDTPNTTAVTAEKIRVLGHKARAALAQEDFHSTIYLAERGLNLDPKWVEGHRLVCRAYTALKRFSEAFHACKRVLANVPQDVAFQNYRQELASKFPPIASTKPADVTPKPPKSKTEAVKKSSPSWQARVQELSQNGLRYQTKTKYKEAEAQFSDALTVINKVQGGKEIADVRKFRVKLYGHRARCRLAMEKFEAAAADAKAGMGCQSDWVDGYRLLCRALMGQHAWRQAMDACDRVLARVPHDVIFTKFKQQLLEKPETQKKKDKAVQFQASPSLSVHREFQSLCDQAMKLVKASDFKSAESCCSDAIDLLKTKQVADSMASLKARVYIDRARCYAEFGAFDRMLLDAGAGLTYNPQWVEGHRLRCVALMHLGKWEEAKGACDHVLAQLPKDEAFLKHRARIATKLVKPVRVTSETTTPSRGYSATPIRNTPPSSRSESNEDDTDSTSADKDRTHLIEFGFHPASMVVKRYLAVKRLISKAHREVDCGALKAAFESVREAFDLWPRLQLPKTLLDDLLLIAPQDAIAWGGRTLYVFAQAMSENFDSVASERAFWTRQLDRHPDDSDIQVALADAVFRSEEVDLSLSLMEKAMALEEAINSTSASNESHVHARYRRVSRINWSYLRARCLPLEAEPESNWFVALFTKPKQPRESRAEAYLTFIHMACLDDEWFPHACYSLGMLFLAKKEYVRAKQFHYLAEVAESRREQLGFFAPIDARAFEDKKMLRAAFSPGLMVLSLNEQSAAIGQIERLNDVWHCALCCGVALNVEYFVRHKLEECPVRRSWSAPRQQ